MAEMEKMTVCLNVKADLLAKFQGGFTDGPKLPQQSMLGNQSLSTKKSAPRAKFGTSARSKGLSSSQVTPSPMEYTPAPMLGRVAASNGASYRRSSPIAKFGTAKRDAAEIKSTTPGPGTILPSSLGNGKPLMFDSKTKSPPRCAFGKSSGSGATPESHKTPGPGSYPIASALGNQVLARNKSAPTIKFGSSSRDDMYAASDTPAASLDGSTFGGSRPVTSESTKRRAPKFTFGTGRDKDATPEAHKTPAPASYQLGSTIVRSPISTRKSPPAPKFGTSTRDGGGMYRIVEGPGPGAHDGATRASSLGRQSSSRNRSCPTMKFGKPTERGDKPSNDYPAPNAYGDVQRGIGKMQESKKRSLPSFSFGISRADADRKLASNKTPGPDYSVPSTIGRQKVSTIKNLGSVSIGRGSRFAKSNADDTPAPNAYPTQTAIGVQVASTRPTSPTPSFGISREAADRHHSGGSKSTPAAKYLLPSSLSTQLLSTKRSLPRAKFGTSKRDGPSSRDQTPGPGSYRADAFTAVAKSAASYSFRSTGR